MLRVSNFCRRMPKRAVQLGQEPNRILVPSRSCLGLQHALVDERGFSIGKEAKRLEDCQWEPISFLNPQLSYSLTFSRLPPGIPCITDCVIAELESLGPKFRIALRVARDPRFERLPCSHKGSYADDCIIDRITAHKCYCVATCDRDLRRRVRKIPVSTSVPSSNRSESRNKLACL